MNRAAIYVRVSTVRQAERDLSIPDQISQCRDYCERLGWEVIEIFSEPGASALDDDRAVFQELIAKATAPTRPFNYVVVHSLSRFSRDALHSELYVRRLRKAGVQLVSVTQSIGDHSEGDLVRKIFNVFDEHQSRETAKHVSRSMCENARQGFWNGSKPPFGYRTVTRERRGNKDKKKLELYEPEAKVVRQIFEMASGHSGRVMGVQAIASFLNDRGTTRRGHLFSTSSIHKILTCSTYHGRHVFNRFDSRNRTPHPPSKWIAVDVPAIVDEPTFLAVQELLSSRRPQLVPPRVVNGPTLLAGVARCGLCGAALVLNTGKGGRYRYYSCTGRMKHGPVACKGIRIPMARLDDIVMSQLLCRVLEPTRIQELLARYVETSVKAVATLKERHARAKALHSEASAGITRLLELIERGLVSPDDPEFRQRLNALKLQKEEAGAESSLLGKRIEAGMPEITPEKVAAFASLMRDALLGGPPELRQAYVRLLVREVSLTHDEIRISGSRQILSKCAAGELERSTPAVLSFVREWRALRESNPSFQRERLTS